jgi:UDP-2,4-diacetamido-2,4,6-trideoxy-beta-L-altropyranose hydrolase
VLAANQVAAATALEAAGASPSLDVGAPDFDEAFGAQIARLIGDAALRASLSAASAQVCDGGGAARVTAALLTRITRA